MISIISWDEHICKPVRDFLYIYKMHFYCRNVQRHLPLPSYRQYHIHIVHDNELCGLSKQLCRLCSVTHCMCNVKFRNTSHLMHICLAWKEISVNDSHIIDERCRYLQKRCEINFHRSHALSIPTHQKCPLNGFYLLVCGILNIAKKVSATPILVFK